MSNGVALRWVRGAGATLGAQPIARALAADEVRVRVRVAGICRTDLFAADGLLPAHDGVVLGHELCGVVEAIGPAVRDLTVGVRVTANPYVRCGGCAACIDGRVATCPRPRLLGVERDGVFASHVLLPRSALHPLPDAVDDRAGAFVEPVAAALGVLQAPIAKAQWGAIWGTHRIARLMHALLRAHGFERVELVDEGEARVDEARFDFVVEATPTSEAMDRMLRAVKPRGCIVLKSRPPSPITLDLARAVEKEVTLRAVRYGSFEDAIALLASGRLPVDELFGPAHPLDDWAAAFAEARAERRKIFLAPADVVACAG